MRLILPLLLSLLGTLASCGAPGHSESAAVSAADAGSRLDWWREARFGLFLHWGLYAVPAGKWGQGTDYAEWIQNSAHIPVETYEGFLEQFNPVEFDADAWVLAAKAAGMKYIVITSKHHDGFALFDSKVSDYDVMATPFQRDVMQELAAACARHGLRMCWYHSIMDWHHPDYLPRRGWEQGTRSAEGADLDRYVEYLRAQVTELLTNYGPIGVMWFDGEWEATWNHDYGQALYDLCRELQPEVIVNNRVDVGRGGMAGMSTGPGYAGDFGTPEQEIPPTGLPGVDWETCMTMNRHWGYNERDHDYKSATDLVRKLCDIASKGGNFLLNIGPTARGTFPDESLERLREIGAWMDVNGGSIHGTSASPFAELPWGRCTVKPGRRSTRIYLQVFDWPADGHLVVPGLGNQPVGARLLADPGRGLVVERQGGDLVVRMLPEAAPSPHASVIELTVEGAPVVYQPPVILAGSDQLVHELRVRLEVPSEDLEIRYTTNGRDPGAASPRYSAPLVLTGTTTVKARSFHQGEAVSGVVVRRITHISEVIGMEGEVVTMQDLFTFQYEGEDADGKLFGAFQPSGMRPHFLPRAQYFGLERALMEACSSGAGTGQ
ncbi:MAG: alpha-L-fucosidase [Planctomycetes bacterium]|nr:alpha-L-fucosidase [Planctomycetota bacterium]